MTESNQPVTRAGGPGAGVGPITGPQRKALAYLASVPWASPVDLGEVLGGTSRMKAQGLGRLGGTMGTRLVRLGLARHASRERSGYPAYAITEAGKEAVRDGR